MNKLILASASPRRKELLAQIGLEFEVIKSDAEEITKGTLPGEIVKELSLLKAADIFEKLSKEQKKERIIIGADTVVACDGRIMGKPKDRQQAFEMISRLQGREHQVYTGVSLVWECQSEGVPKAEDKEGALQKEENPKFHAESFYEETSVSVYPMTEQEIWDYIDSGEPMDKAGAYGIQGKFAAFIKGIAGDYNNVVGLPIGRLYQELKKLI